MQGPLFTQDFLRRGIGESEPWRALEDARFKRFETTLRDIFGSFGSSSTLNRAQTEQRVIERGLRESGRSGDYVAQVNLSGKRREDVPDVPLFALFHMTDDARRFVTADCSARAASGPRSGGGARAATRHCHSTWAA